MAKENGNRKGNFKGYYAYRLKGEMKDPRLNCFKKEWFEGKKCWDIGCNAGEITIEIARRFEPAYMIGTDLDPELIATAKGSLVKRVQNNTEPIESVENASDALPKSFQTWTVLNNRFPDELRSHVRNIPVGTSAIGLCFPYNIVFRCEDIVKQEHQGRMYDTITCLSVSKWIHLYHGDDGLKQVFEKIYRALLPGGQFILEPQPWKTYHNRKFTTAETAKHYDEIELRPKDFEAYLTQQVGFRSCEFLEVCQTSQKGFKRPLYVYTK